MTKVVVLAVAAGVVAVGVNASAGAAPSLVIQGDRVLAGVRILSRRGPLERRFGVPDSARRRGPYECVLVWREHGLVANLLELSRRAPCRDGVFVSAAVTGRAWRTAKGLRIGSPVATLRTLYPKARLERGGFAPWRGWWLVSRRACPEVGGTPYPGLLARVRAGKVSALVMLVTACE